jgi:diaminohydroxyphosphoribosylaminopyrimidine deaminase/5-amino-6-(5-phosphoribosylamino)uracil reductase
MAAALELSRSHTGLTGTNPSVGCVLVKDGVVVGAAVTAVGGRPHAEAGALAIAGDAARGATAYVTLEPCAHHGKTPPCANALVAAGVSRVVISVIDPDERVAGKGVQILSEAGIEVETGIMVAEGKRALAGYLTRKIKKRPHVILKLAISADGMIGKKDAGQVAITGPQSREAVHHLRAECDAILVGIGTALADDPELTVRIPGLEQRSPIRIVLDRKLELPLSSKLVKTARDVPVIAVTNDPLSARRGALEAAGVEVLAEDDLQGLLASLGARGLSSLLVEGGAAIARSFLDAGLVDRILLFEAPVVIGEGGVETPLERSDISGQYSFVGERLYGPDRCFDYERGL